MEKLNFVKNGVSRLPPGFRFQPTDEELVFQYLKSKVFSCQLPASIIPEINVCKYDPWDLPGNNKGCSIATAQTQPIYFSAPFCSQNYGKRSICSKRNCDQQERYFFSSKEAKYRNGNRMNRTTNSGYWKATGSDKKITSSISNGIAGIRKALVFYEGKSPNGSRTDWVMHEYRLVSVETTICNSSQNYVNEIGDWVLCRIFMKKRSIESDDNTAHMLKNNTVMNVHPAQPIFFDFMRVHKSAPGPIRSTTSSSCSSSSNVMEVSSSDHEETSGYADF